MNARSLTILTVAVIGLGLPMLLLPSRPTDAMPTFAQSYGYKCSVCHTMVPLLNSYGRYVQRTGYAALDRHVLAHAIPVWVGEAGNYDSSAGAGTGVPRFSFGNLDIHAIGYATPDITYHIQQWITADDQAGPLDTMWISYNNLLHRDAHLFVGKILNPAPSPYSQTFDLDGPSASSTLVGEHDWGATYDNRWGSKLAYEHSSLDIQAGYFLSGEDLNGATDFGAVDKTFQWKAAIARPDKPVEYGFFGSAGTVPVSTGTDQYSSFAAYLQIDPKPSGIPGLLAIAQREHDGNPGVDDNTGLIMPATSSQGLSLELFEPLAAGNVVVSFRHDINSDGFRTVTVGNALNIGANVPGIKYLHAYFESALGGTSSLLGASGGPTWKGTLWLTIPVAKLH